jgi:hypothetical protein
MHLNAKGKASAAKLLVNWVNCTHKWKNQSVWDGKLCVYFLHRMIVGCVSAAYVEGTCLQNLVCLHSLQRRISEQHLTHTDANTIVLSLFYGDDTVTPVCCANHAKDFLGDISSFIQFFLCILLLFKIGSVAVNLFTDL